MMSGDLAMRKKALIIGCDGQDGSILFEKLQAKEYEIIGIDINNVRQTSSESIAPIDINNRQQVSEVLNKFKPDEIYYLAAFHRSAEGISEDDVETFRKSFAINVFSLINVLDGIVQYSKKSKLFYAASSHIFGDSKEIIQNESTPFQPNCIYGITKAAGTRVCQYYRANHGIFASVGILYNHESSRRAPNFASRKIIKAAVAIKHQEQQKLLLGDLTARIDWGFAPDYVEAMHKILNCQQADDFVIASGQMHTVRDFVSEVFSFLGLDYEQYVEINPDLLTKKGKNNLQGESAKLRAQTGWQPKVSFKDFIKLMVAEELSAYAKR